MLYKKGFTLLEVLIALFIFTLVSIIMASALRTVLTAQTHTEKQAMRLEKLQIALLLLSRDIEQAIDRPVLNANESVGAAFIGTSHSLVLTHAGLANPLGQLQRSTLERTGYRLKGTTLIRENWPVLDAVKTTQPNQRILLNTVTKLRFQYLDQEGQFQKTWPPADQPNAPPRPIAVRVFLTLNDWGTLSQLYVIPH